MSGQNTTFEVGSEAGLRFVGQWCGQASGTAAERTRGKLSVQLEGVPIWGGSDAAQGIDWAWIELLEWMTTSWPYLLWEESYPWPLKPRTPMALGTELDKQGDQMAEVDFEALAEEVDTFLETHDLALGLGGISLPAFRLLREGNCFVVSNPGRTARVDANEVITALEALGETLRKRLDPKKDGRSRQAVGAWGLRGASDHDQFLSVYTGWSTEDVEFLKGADAQTDADRTVFEPTEILAAARLAGPLVEPAELSAWFEQIRGVKHHTTPLLDDLGSSLDEDLQRITNLRAWEQGVRLAQQVRPRLPGGTVEKPLDVDQAARNLGIEIGDLEPPGPRELDAVAVWGPNHGPVIFVNRKGRHARSHLGRRASIAHELCHLLVDRSRSLPLADVIGGHGSLFLESRANAFAADLLLPQTVIRDLHTAGDMTTKSCSSLFRRFRVSRQLGALQVLNSRVSLDFETRSQMQTWSRRG